jgi:hypothetical protein
MPALYLATPSTGLLTSSAEKARLAPEVRSRKRSTMHDARVLLDMGADAVRRLARRGYTLDLSGLEDLVARRSKSIQKDGELRAESKRVSRPRPGRAAT